jgi:dienelactone hydrolase
MLIDAEIQEFDRRLRELLGVEIPDVPLDAEIEAEERLEGLTRRLVRYNVAEGERIGAYLLIPDSARAKTPGILAIHQHAGQFDLGKSEPAGLTSDPMYHYGMDLARRGYVVLCPDLLAFEERQTPKWCRPGDGPWYERFEAMRLFLEGSSLQAKYLADLVKGLDYLTSLDFVDPERIGAIGHSLGGQETLWLTWFDPRVKAGVSSCGFGLMRAVIRDGINHNMAAYVPGFLSLGDTDLIAAGIAPRAFFFSAGDEDGIFPIDSVRKIAASVEAVYDRLGHPENTEYVEFHGGHGLPDEVKAQAYAFLDAHLKSR